jgi:hypothetical protein
MIGISQVSRSILGRVACPPSHAMAGQRENAMAARYDEFDQKPLRSSDWSPSCDASWLAAGEREQHRLHHDRGMQRGPTVRMAAVVSRRRPTRSADASAATGDPKGTQIATPRADRAGFCQFRRLVQSVLGEPRCRTQAKVETDSQHVLAFANADVVVEPTDWIEKLQRARSEFVAVVFDKVGRVVGEGVPGPAEPNPRPPLRLPSRQLIRSVGTRPSRCSRASAGTRQDLPRGIWLAMLRQPRPMHDCASDNHGRRNPAILPKITVSVFHAL